MLRYRGVCLNGVSVFHNFCLIGSHSPPAASSLALSFCRHGFLVRVVKFSALRNPTKRAS